VGAHRQVIFTGFGVDTIALFPDLFSKTLVDGDTDDSCHQRLISESRFLRLHHSSQEVLSVHPLERHRSRKQIAAEAQQVWKEEIEGKHGGISDRRKMIKSCDER